MARITIIVEDNVVYKNGACSEVLDLSSCNIPENVKALQWEDTKGHIEFYDQDNVDITNMPEWANSAVNVMEQGVTEPPEEIRTASSYYVDQTYWDDYPPAHLPDIQEFISQQHPGVKLDVAYRNNNPDKDPVGIFMIGVSTGSGGLSGTIACVEKAEALGIPLFSDITNKWQEGFVNFVEDQQWTIWNSPDGLYNSAYRTYTLDIHKARKKRIINRDRDENIKQGYDDGTNIWDIDTASMTNMSAKVLSSTDTDNIVWRTKGNVNITMTGAEFKKLVVDATAYIDQLYVESWTRKGNVDAASNITEVDAA